MTSRHRPFSYARTTEEGKAVVRVGCECGQSVLAAASTATEARGIAKRVREHHRGNAVAGAGVQP